MLLVSTHRDRLVALVVVVALSGLCWAWLGKMIWDMGAMPMQGAAGSLSSVRPGYVVWLVLMWLVMMAAMMLPSALPMTLAFADVSSGQDRRSSVQSVVAFILGYVGAWAAFSLGAAVGQMWLEQTAVWSSMAMALKIEAMAGGVLIAAGVYQWTPLKHVCLKKCRSPFGFLATEWRDGLAGAVVMGWRHGLFCVGCCWALMALLFVAGVMNTLWIIALTLLVVVEKVAPYGDLIARLTGLGLALAGAWLALA